MNSKENSISNHVVQIGSQLWVSELFGIAMLFLFVLLFAPVGYLIISNDSKIRNNIRNIATYKSQAISLRNELNELREKNIISKTLESFSNSRLSKENIAKLTDIVFDNSKTYGYDPLLVLAVIHVESVFDPNAKGQYKNGTHSGALGLMQLKLETAKEVGKDIGITVKSSDDLLIPEINVAIGVAYLTRLISKFKDLKLGILAYNQGPRTVRESLKGERPFSIKYYNKVLRSYKKLKAVHARENKQ